MEYRLTDDGLRLSADIRLTAHETNAYGSWKYSNILAAIQQTAMYHAHTLGCSRDVLIRKGMVWIVVRTHIVFSRVPVVGDTVTATTWYSDVNKVFFPRSCLFQCGDETVGRAVSLWLVFDINERKMLPPSAIAPFPERPGFPALLPMPGRVKMPKGAAVETFERTVRFSEVDINGHMNNTCYGDWISDALGRSVFSKGTPKELLISYNEETTDGRTLLAELHRGEGVYGLKCDAFSALVHE